jgi:hypothetical protein
LFNAGRIAIVRAGRVHQQLHRCTFFIMIPKQPGGCSPSACRPARGQPTLALAIRNCGERGFANPFGAFKTDKHAHSLIF